MHILAPTDLNSGGNVRAESVPAGLGSLRTSSVGDVTVTGEISLGLGFISLRGDEIADVFVRIERFGSLGIDFAISPIASFGAAAVRGADHDFRRAQFVGERSEMLPNLERDPATDLRCRWKMLCGTTFVGGNLHRETVAIVRGEDTEGQANVLEVVHALDALCFSICFGQSGQEHTCQNGDNSDDDQQLNERERQVFVFAKNAVHMIRLIWVTEREL